MTGQSFDALGGSHAARADGTEGNAKAKTKISVKLVTLKSSLLTFLGFNAGGLEGTTGSQSHQSSK